MKKFLCGGILSVCLLFGCASMASAWAHMEDFNLNAASHSAKSGTRTAHNFQGRCLVEDGSAGAVKMELRQAWTIGSDLLEQVTVYPSETRFTNIWGRDDTTIRCFLRLEPVYNPAFTNPGCAACGTLFYD